LPKSDVIDEKQVVLRKQNHNHNRTTKKQERELQPEGEKVMAFHHDNVDKHALENFVLAQQFF
jgi:hypothetical protein